MGMTIHYKLNSPSTSIKAVRDLVGQLRQHALDLPLKNVGEIVEFSGAQPRLFIRHDRHGYPLSCPFAKHNDEPRC